MELQILDLELLQTIVNLVHHVEVDGHLLHALGADSRRITLRLLLLREQTLGLHKFRHVLAHDQAGLSDLSRQLTLHIFQLASA